MDYQDDNRYNAEREAHLTLKRAEKARILVNKLPGNIWCDYMTKTLVWLPLILDMIFVFPMLSAGIDAGMVETLTAKVNAWEDERGHAFLYDGVSVFTHQ